MTAPQTKPPLKADRYVEKTWTSTRPSPNANQIDSTFAGVTRREVPWALLCVAVLVPCVRAVRQPAEFPGANTES